MAFQLTVDPDLEAKLWYQGIMEGAKGFSQGIDKAGQGLAAGLKQQKDDSKMFKSLQQYADSAGIATKDETTPMDLDSLKGLVEGSVAKRVNTEALQRMQMNDQLQKMRGMQMQGMQQQIDEPQQNQRLYEELGNIGQPPPVPRAGMVGRVDESGATIPGSITPQAAGPATPPAYSTADVLGAIKRAGWAGKPEAVDNFIKQLQSGNPQANIPLKHDVGGGYVGFTLPGSKNLDIRPDLTQAPNMTAQPIEDADGNVISYGMPNGKGGFTVLKKPAAGATGNLMPVTDPVSGSPIPGFGMDGAGKVHDFRSLIEKARGAGAAPAAGAAAGAEGPARPASKEEFDALPKGALYINPKDGKVYRKK